MQVHNKNNKSISSTYEQFLKTQRGSIKSYAEEAEERYNYSLDSAVAEAEKLLNDAKKILQNQF
ncbi:hypothetical protein [Neptuniibacter sp.]|uniref:hypothetical protein n=1 Tax=Neptuniibacter sp. TaxID=1962643 RepID=UPI002613822D|nr:hypothetical protein [Neptuniibacter sp.]MCP4595834.1 hypothetical protein [Neptuniibacter sp.]